MLLSSNKPIAPSDEGKIVVVHVLPDRWLFHTPAEEEHEERGAPSSSSSEEGGDEKDEKTRNDREGPRRRNKKRGRCLVAAVEEEDKTSKRRGCLRRSVVYESPRLTSNIMLPDLLDFPPMCKQHDEQHFKLSSSLIPRSKLFALPGLQQH